MKCKIGTIADQFGIHPQTVRFYEREKLFRAELGESSTRYYTARDFKRMASLRRYLLMGFGTREARRLFACEGPEEVAAQVRARKQEVFAQIRDLNRTLWSLDQYEAGLVLVDRLLGRCEMAERPKMLLFINQKGQSLDVSEEALLQLRRWTRHLDIVSNASVVPCESFLEPDVPRERISGFCIPAATARQFGVSADGPLVRTLPAQRCLHTVVCLDGPAEDTRRLFGTAIDYMRQNGLRVCGDAVGRILSVIKEGYNEKEHTPLATYYEYFIPVQEQTP